MKFEESSKELEEIIKKLENGTTLEEGVKLFERGSELVKQCYSALDEARGKIVNIKSEIEKK